MCCPQRAFTYVYTLYGSKKEEAAVISLYIISILVFITEAERVYCAVRAVYLQLTIFIVLKGCMIGFNDATADETSDL